MSYKDLNVYQRVYKVAIDLHLFLLNSKENKIIPQNERRIRHLAREVLGNIAEGFYQKSQKAKRFFNFKAKDACNKMLLDLEFLQDVKAIPADEYDHFKNEYDIAAKQLYKMNQASLDRENQTEDVEETEEVEKTKAVSA